MRRNLAFLSAALLFAVALSGCSNDNTSAAEQPDRGDSPAVKIVASDIKLDKKEYRATAGEVRLRYVDEGAMPHSLKIEGINDFKLNVRVFSDVDEGTVDLRPGKYTIYCDVAGHREAGMHAVLDVTPATATSGADASSPSTTASPATSSAATTPAGATAADD